MVYRKNPKYEAQRLAELDRNRLEGQKVAEEDAKHAEVAQRIAKKTEKNRMKREKKKSSSGKK